MKLYTPKEALNYLVYLLKLLDVGIRCFRVVSDKRRIPESEVDRLLGTYNLISPVSSTVCVATDILSKFTYLHMYYSVFSISS